MQQVITDVLYPDVNKRPGFVNMTYVTSLQDDSVFKLWLHDFFLVSCFVEFEPFTG